MPIKLTNHGKLVSIGEVISEDGIDYTLVSADSEIGIFLDATIRIPAGFELFGSPNRTEHEVFYTLLERSSGNYVNLRALLYLPALNYAGRIRNINFINPKIAGSKRSRNSQPGLARKIPCK